MSRQVRKIAGHDIPGRDKVGVVEAAVIDVADLVKDGSHGCVTTNSSFVGTDCERALVP